MSVAISKDNDFNAPLCSVVREDFPLLQFENTREPFHYLDNAATTQKPRSVISAITECYENQLAPIHRGLYPLAENASQLYEQARVDIGRFINAPQPGQLIFTRSCTESINMVAQGWARERLQPGDWVWVTRMEHHSNFLPWQRVCQQTGAELRIIDLDESGQLFFPEDEQLFDQRTKLIAITHVSNVLGIENPVADLCAKARGNNIAVLIDGAQAVSHLAVNVTELDCDFYTFSAHKMYGPAGIGALYVKPERMAEMQPLLLGGGMVDWVDDQQAGWSEVPSCFEAGSPNLPGAVGFAAAVKYMQTLTLDRVKSHIGLLTELAVYHLRAISGVRVFADYQQSKSSLISFDIAGVHPHDFAQIAGERSVAIRAGHHCCQPLMKHLGVAATNRVSFAVYSSISDMKALLNAIEYAQKVFK